MIKSYTITLEENIVNEAKELFKKNGIKLSSLMNELLKEWISKNGN